MFPFFFTDSPTPAIYTLSLHDALPIFAGLQRSVDDANQHHDADVVVEPGIDDQRLQRCGRIAFRRRDADRKSTRLNSSHGYISYAVFCLKKKKNKRKYLK